MRRNLPSVLPDVHARARLNGHDQLTRRGLRSYPPSKWGFESLGARAWRCRQRDRKRVQFPRPWSCARACQRRGTHRVPSRAPGREFAGEGHRLARFGASPACDRRSPMRSSDRAPNRRGEGRRTAVSQTMASRQAWWTGEHPFESQTVVRVSAAMASRTARLLVARRRPVLRRPSRPGPTRASIEPLADRSTGLQPT